jgi:dihydrofolate reductase
MTTLSIIVAAAQNGVIGINNTLPWHLPEDLKRFRALTTGHHIIMGRKTYESLNRLLPDRTTVIVTRNRDYVVPGAIVVNSLQEAIERCEGDTEAFLIGGAELYAEGFRFAHKLYLTEIHADYVGDAVLPEFDRQHWQEISRESHTSANGIRFSYVTYLRKEGTISPREPS